MWPRRDEAAGTAVPFAYARRSLAVLPLRANGRASIIMKRRTRQTPQCEHLEARTVLSGSSLWPVGLVSGSTVQGTVALELAPGQWPSGTTDVAWRLDGRPLSGPIAAAPFRFAWETAATSDGLATIQAIAIASDGSTLAEGTPLVLEVDNLPGPAWATSRTVSVVPDVVTSGRLSLTVRMDIQDIDATWDAYALIGLDGDQVAALNRWGVERVGPRDITISIDTSNLSNGPHVLSITTQVINRARTERRTVDWMTRTILVDNGTRPIGLRSYGEVVLATGGSMQLSPRVALADGTERPVNGPVSYTIEGGGAGIVALGTDGVATGLSDGRTRVQITAEGLSEWAPITVRSRATFPHFGRDGAILDQYEPGRSMFVTSLFGLDGDQLDASPALATMVRDAGINTLTQGFYHNPADMGETSFTRWVSQTLPLWSKLAGQLERHDLSFLAIGDDLARFAHELRDSVVSNPWAADAIRVAFERLKATGRVVGVEMVDEVSAIWGDTPHPTDGRWASLGLPDDAIARLVAAIRAVPDGPAITWPAFAGSSPTASAAWMADPTVSDYASIYWYQPNFELMPDSYTNSQVRDDMAGRVEALRPRLDPTRPSLMIGQLCGPYYRSTTSAGAYQPGIDYRISAAPTPTQVAAEIAYAATAGMAGVRSYSFDSTRWKQDRLNGGGQTGSDPFEVGTDRWQAMAAGNGFVHNLEPVLFQPTATAPDFGEGIETTARSGPNGRLVMAVNLTDQARVVHLDLAPYAIAAGAGGVRWRLLGSSLGSTEVAGAGLDTLTLAPGEAVAWEFQANDAQAPSIQFARPLADAVVAGLVPVRVEASDGGAIDRVEFYSEGTLVATDRSFPYEFSWDATEMTRGVWHGLKAIAYDTSGHASEARVAVRVETAVASVEPSAPAAPVLSPGSDTGASSSDGLTSTRAGLSFQVSGTAQGSRVDLVRTDSRTGLASVVATTTATSDNTALIDPGTLLDATSYSYVVVQRQADGRQQISAATTVRIDATAPVVPSLSLLYTKVNPALPLMVSNVNGYFVGRGEPGQFVQIVAVDFTILDRVIEVVGAGEVDPKGNYTVDFPVREGSPLMKVRARVIDRAGNISPMSVVRQVRAEPTIFHGGVVNGSVVRSSSVVTLSTPVPTQATTTQTQTLATRSTAPRVSPWTLASRRVPIAFRTRPIAGAFVDRQAGLAALRAFRFAT
jgi:hypothetical protein